MLETTDFPDRGEYPYRALIRIRYQNELDTLLIRQLQHAVAGAARPEVAAEFQSMTTKLVLQLLRTEAQPVDAGARGAAFVAFGEDGPLCGNDRQDALIRWLIEHGLVPPVPDPDPVYYSADLAMVVLAAREAISQVASQQVAGDLLNAVDSLTTKAFD